MNFFWSNICENIKHVIYLRCLSKATPPERFQGNKNKTKMKTNINPSASEFVNGLIAKCEKVLSVCDKEIEYLTHPEKYGCCLSYCNSIVINKERLMCVTTDKEHRATYELSPLYPTYFSPKSAAQIMENEIFTDRDGKRIKMEIVGKLEYYHLLRAEYANKLASFKEILN